MKLRIIILVLSLLTVLSTLIGGHLYFSALKETAIGEVEREGRWHADLTREVLDQQLKNSQMAVKGLSGHDEMIQALGETNKVTLENANKILDNFKIAFKASVSYLMDREGNTIASSNRNDSSSFEGKNYAFRPYFKQAIQGTPSIYVALGVTSGKRGIYFSHAVYSHAQEKPLGVVVMKAPVDTLENELLGKRSSEHGMITVVTDPNGLIFMSEDDKYRFQLLENISNETISEISVSKQYGDIPLEWSGFTVISETRMIDTAGIKYMMSQQGIKSLPGWRVVHLHNLNTLLTASSSHLPKNLGPLILALCLIVGMSVTILYRMARDDLIRRKEAEKLLNETKNQLQYLVSSSPAVIYTKKVSGDYGATFISGNITSQLGYEPRDFTEDSRFWKNHVHPEDLQRILDGMSSLFEHGRHLHEYRFLNKDGDYRWMHDEMKLIRDAEGKVEEIIGSWIDITDKKQVEKALETKEKYLNEAERIGHLGAWVWNIKDNSEWWSDEQFRIFGYEPGEIEPVYETFVESLHPEDKEAVSKALEKTFEEREPFDIEFRIIRPDGAVRFVHARGNVKRSENEDPLQMSGTVLDITDHKKAEQQREKFIIELQNALDQINTLEGLVPICSHCKSVRDDKGYWTQVESYINLSSGGDFSHGICPKCAEQYYPEMDLYGD